MKNKVKEYIKNNIVFLISLIIVFCISIFCVIKKEGLDLIAKNSLSSFNNSFAWLYVVTLPLFFAFLLFLVFSKFGKIKLGKDFEKPEYSNLSWFAMLFCAGTGIGLVYWSVAEPLAHYVNPPLGIESQSIEAARFSIRTCFLHWGILPWTCFALTGLGIAYFQYRKGKSGLISYIFQPIIGEKGVKGKIGKTIDIFSIIVSVVGVATSLGLGCLQISGGLNYLFGISNNELTWLILIVFVTIVYLFSSITGLNKGIKFLSNINSYLAIVFLILGIHCCSNIEIVNTFLKGVSDHILFFIKDSFYMGSGNDLSWVMDWKVFYWAWWISWAPFVGMFIARISKGRSIREFVLAVVIIPSILTFIWFSVFGNMTFSITKLLSLEELSVALENPNIAVFIIFEKLPIYKILSIFVVVLLFIFFITSADSATFSLSTLSSNGSLNPPTYKKVVWGIVEAIIAFLLICVGNIKSLQTLSIVFAFPFLIILMFMCYTLIKDIIKNGKANK